MTEYFIGILPPEPLYNKIINIQKKYISRLGVEPHITLKAQSGLSENEKWISKVENIISNFNTFKVNINDISYFGEVVLFIEVNSSNLTLLHNKLIESLEINSEEQKKYFEGKDFVGHITVAKTTYPSNLSSDVLSSDQLKVIEKELSNVKKTESFIVEDVWIFKKINNSYERYKKLKLKKN
ncbi:nucleotidyltransferase [Macrococcus capreoli]